MWKGFFIPADFSESVCRLFSPICLQHNKKQNFHKKTCIRAKNVV